MRYRLWTGPCYVNEVAAALAALPDSTNVLAGTEHVYFDSPHSPRGIERLAHERGETRPCWGYLDGLRRTTHLDAKLNDAPCSKDLACAHCTSGTSDSH